MADRICQHIVTGQSVRNIGEMEDMPCDQTLSSLRPLTSFHG
ncbi:hypothetical protein [Rhizobium leguminosarum]